MTYANYIVAMFKDDADIKVEHDNEVGDDAIFNVFIYCNNKIKLLAIKELLPESVAMGNITVKNLFKYTGKRTVDADLLKVAFAGNPIVSEIVAVETPFQTTVDYCVFKKEVIQFYNDEMMDINGNYNGLAQDIARSIFVQDANASYCTAAE